MQALLNLLLTGRASPHLFNGMRHFGQDGLPLQRPLQGVLSRSDVGYLRWSREEMERGALPQVETCNRAPLAHTHSQLCVDYRSFGDMRKQQSTADVIRILTVTFQVCLRCVLHPSMLLSSVFSFSF